MPVRGAYHASTPVLALLLLNPTAHALAASRLRGATATSRVAATATRLRAAPVANPGATSSQTGFLANLAAKNAEGLARKEGKTLIKEVGRLPVCPRATLEAKPAVLAKLLEREGCVGVPEAISADTAATLRSFIEAERDNARAADRIWHRERRQLRFGHALL